MPLGATWTAIASTATVDARDNTGTNPSSKGVPIYRLDDTLIAIDNSDLWDGDILNPISIDETGASFSGTVWTGTSALGGAAGGHLGAPDPILILGFAAYGTTDYPADVWPNWWIYSNDAPSDARLPFYAISSPLTVPSAVPIPGAVFLFGGALAGLLGVSWRRRSAST